MRVVSPTILFTVICSGSLLAQELQLPDHPVVVGIPEGFVDFSEWVHTEEASLHFQLPARPGRGTPAFPAIALRASPEMAIEEAERTLAEYARSEIERPTLTVIMQPVFLLIGGQPAVEFATSGKTIFDFVDGRAGSAEMLMHEIAVAYRSRIYSCTLEIGPEAYEEYLENVRRFCRSMRFVDSVQ